MYWVFDCLFDVAPNRPDTRISEVETSVILPNAGRIDSDAVQKLIPFFLVRFFPKGVEAHHNRLGALASAILVTHRSAARSPTGNASDDLNYVFALVERNGGRLETFVIRGTKAKHSRPHGGIFFVGIEEPRLNFYVFGWDFSRPQSQNRIHHDRRNRIFLWHDSGGNAGSFRERRCGSRQLLFQRQHGREEVAQIHHAAGSLAAGSAAGKRAFPPGGKGLASGS